MSTRSITLTVNGTPHYQEVEACTLKRCPLSRNTDRRAGQPRATRRRNLL